MTRFVFAESSQVRCSRSIAHAMVVCQASRRVKGLGSRLVRGFTTGADWTWTAWIQLYAFGKESSVMIYGHEAESVP